MGGLGLGLGSEGVEGWVGGWGAPRNGCGSGGGGGGHRVTLVDPEQKNEDQLLRSRKEVKMLDMPE